MGLQVPIPHQALTFLLSLRLFPRAGPHPQGPRGHGSAVAVDGQRAGQWHPCLRRYPHCLPVGADGCPLRDPVSRGLGGRVESCWELILPAGPSSSSRALCRALWSQPQLPLRSQQVEAESCSLTWLPSLQQLCCQ